MTHEHTPHESPGTTDGADFDVDLMLRDEAVLSQSVEVSHKKFETGVDTMHKNLELEEFISFDRATYTTLRDDEALDVRQDPDRQEPDMYDKFVKNYQPALVRTIDGHIAKRQAAVEKIDSLLALYDKTKGATLTVEETLMRVPGQLIAIINELGRSKPRTTDHLDPGSERFDAINVYEANKLMEESVYSFGNDISILRHAGDELIAAYDQFIKSTDFIGKRVKAIEDLTDEDYDDEVVEGPAPAALDPSPNIVDAIEPEHQDALSGLDNSYDIEDGVTVSLTPEIKPPKPTGRTGIIKKRKK